MNYNNLYVQSVLKKITDGEFKTKEDLVEFLKKLLHAIENDEKLFNSLCKEGVITRADPNHYDFLRYFVDYYNKTKEEELNLNLDDVASIEIDDQKYIKYKDSDGEYRIIEDNENGKTFVEQIKEKQDESIIFQGKEGKKNAEEILEQMSTERKEYELESIQTTDKDKLNNARQNDLEMALNFYEFQDREIVFNPEANIYLDKNTGETFYVAVDKDGNKSIQPTDELYTKTEEKSLEHTIQAGLDEAKIVETPSEIEEKEYDEIDNEFVNMTDADLEYALLNKDKLPIEYVEKIEKELERRKEALERENLNIQENNKVKKLVMPQLDKTYNGFISFITLVSILLIYGISILTYIFWLIK